ncbi:aminotransferase class V-fold PLP-dependent enzyme [Frigidibacter sp. RF13]|uniref:aminotransferase class V-fold PLP-dependent enzyme n=1 Tax=Frigidibacter sp. RF13 TaxID=2997340 RepID=UPI00226DEB8F|nr:aminotransferase class V-fold PLP-dependent enzyme [Frigidibacter sp. RF13]MCY1125548.1 aminotransferase class V-fold PLP-dependent enzyme [Frigidibacter sp. RF13]
MTDLPDGSRYFLYHSIGQYQGKSADLTRAMAEFAAVWGRADDGQWPAVLGLRQRFIDRWRGILNAPEGSVTTAESVTAAVSQLITALPADRLRGKRLLIAADCFPSVHFLLAGLAAPMGFTLDTVPLRQGAHWVEDEDYLASWDESVGLALLTWVSSTSSHRIALEPLVAHGRRMGSLIGVDITQGAGLLPFDVTAPAVDFAVSTSLKWMCGTPGAGALYVAPTLLPDCEPLLRGWFSQDNPFRWDLDRFAFAPDARRFDHGTPGVMAAAASLPALDWHAGQNPAALLAHNRSLSAAILEGLDDLGLTLASPRDPDQRGGSLMVRLPEGRPAPALVDRLRQEGVNCDARGQTLRLSPGVMTTMDGVAALIASLAGALR